MNAIIFVGLHAAPGTSTTGISFAEKLEILKRRFDACRREGLEVVLIGTGNRAGIEAVRNAIPMTPLYLVEGDMDRQRGECGIGLKALEHADRQKADWIIKVAGDTFHPTPGWAEFLVSLGERSGAELVACAHSRPDWVSTQVFAVRREFMRKTWPPMTADYGRIGIEAQWGERIIAECRLQSAELKKVWLQPEAKVFAMDGCQNWVPAEPAITYLHAHTLAATAGWKPVDTSVQPDLQAKISIVVPARNETYLNPHRGNVPLLTDTFASIAETSPADNLPECILVDDASDKALPIAECRLPNANLRIIRNPTPLGVDPARNIGIAAATGDVIDILDGLMRVATQQGISCVHGIQKLARVALEKNALVVARCAHLELPNHRDPGNLCGATFMPLTAPQSQLAIAWRSQFPPEGVRRINAVLGASYFAPRAVWQRLQGLVNDCRVGGFSEEGISLKAAFLDIPIYYCGDVTLAHWFRPNGPHPFYVDDSEKWLNRARVLKVCFDEKSFRDFWLPRCRQSAWQPDYEQALAAHPLECEAARFRAVKVKADADILKEIFKIGG